MVPLAKLTIITEIKGKTSLTKTYFVFHHLLYILIETEP